MKSIVIFASGTGTNAENIISHFAKTDVARVTAVFCNNPTAGVIARADALGVPVKIFERKEFENGSVLRSLRPINPDLIVLAGFLLKVHGDIVMAYPNRIINIHPALLPLYGGKGMYGMNIHKAVLDNRDTHTGISVHYVNEHYDEGALICQRDISIADCASAEEVAEKVHTLEQSCFPEIIENILLEKTIK